ncbi:hypothetical protein MJ904_14225 [Massilia sp. MB5]|uniref:hypothetical protein n=1 Tax=Massilia sp. MB5 TaxID=2919578 RepID=UPI001F0FEE65|nr:hypothetical protein [Massilia sp. MB5]UMR33209.1 hypothetical protein MJ904_14225 [Massilia sp. MB5]
MIVRSLLLLPASALLLACLGANAAPASASATAKAHHAQAQDKAQDKAKAKDKAKTKPGKAAGGAKEPAKKSAKEAARKLAKAAAQEPAKDKAKSRTRTAAAPEAVHAAPKPAKAAVAASVATAATVATAASAGPASRERKPFALAPVSAPAAAPVSPAAASLQNAPSPDSVYPAIPTMTAKEKAAYARLPVCKLSADGTRLAVEPCRTAPQRRDAPHRSVMPQMPRVPAAAPPTGPQLVLPSAVLDSGRPPATGSSFTPSAASGAAQDNRPVPVANCTPGGCTDIHGNRYIGSGATLTTPSGKSCTNTGGWIQCN